MTKPREAPPSYGHCPRLMAFEGRTMMRVLICALGMIVLVLASPLCVWAIIDRDAIVLALSFDADAVEGDVALDASPNGNNGLLMSGAGLRDGKLGSAVRLHGTAYVEVANDPSLALHGTDFTLAIWAYFDESAGTSTLMAHDEGGGGTKKWGWWYSAGSISLHINNPGGDVAWIRADMFELELDRWYHMALVRTGDLYTHYMDGEPFGETTKDVPIPQEIGHALTIGWSEENFYFQGLLDEALMVRQALAQGDVRRHMSRGAARMLAVQPNDKLTTTWVALKERR